MQSCSKFIMYTCNRATLQLCHLEVASLEHLDYLEKCTTWNLSISQHISSKTQPNLKNYGSFVNSFEFVSNLDQPGPCSFFRL